jgi:Ran GTPase-activating protein (RanGAP) involved in mRNA processing and transport
VLASVLSEIFALHYLDISCNLVCDTGALALAEALQRLPPSSKLTKVSLAGNRIGLKGVLALITAVHHSKNIEFLSVKNNTLTEYDMQSLVKFMDEIGYKRYNVQPYRIYTCIIRVLYVYCTCIVRVLYVYYTSVLVL